MCQLLQKECQFPDAGVAVGVGVASNKSSGLAGFCLHEASTTDPVIKSTTLRDFFTRVKDLEAGLLAHRCCYDVANADYDRSAQDSHGDILVLAHLSFEIERRHQIKQFETSDSQHDPDCAENDGGYNCLKKSRRVPRRCRILRCLSRRNLQ